MQGAHGIVVTHLHGMEKSGVQFPVGPPSQTRLEVDEVAKSDLALIYILYIFEKVRLSKDVALLCLYITLLER